MSETDSASRGKRSSKPRIRLVLPAPGRCGDQVELAGRRCGLCRHSESARASVRSTPSTSTAACPVFDHAGLGAERVGFSIELLHQKIQAPARPARPGSGHAGFRPHGPAAGSGSSSTSSFCNCSTNLLFDSPWFDGLWQIGQPVAKPLNQRSAISGQVFRHLLDLDLNAGQSALDHFSNRRAFPAHAPGLMLRWPRQDSFHRGAARSASKIGSLPGQSCQASSAGGSGRVNWLRGPISASSP